MSANGVRAGRGLTLIPFSADLLPAVQPWFADPEVRHRLGGPEVPVRELELISQQAGSEYRGLTVLRACAWVAIDRDGVPVGKVGGDVYDRWGRFDPSQASSLEAIESGPSMALSYLVDPARRGEGLGRSLLAAVIEHPDVADVRVFVLGIDADNWPSRRSATAVGFVPDPPEADGEGIVYHLRRR